MTRLTVRRALTLLITLVITLTAFPVVNVNATQATIDMLNELDEERQETGARLRETHNLLAGTEFEMSQIMIELEELDRRVEDVMISIENIEYSLSLTEARIAQAEQSLEAARNERDRQYEIFRTRLRAMHEHGPVGLIEVLFQAESIADFFMRMEYVRAVAQFDQDMLERLQSAEAEVNIILDRLYRDRIQVDDLLFLQRREVESLGQAQQERQNWFINLEQNAEWLAELISIYQIEFDAINLRFGEVENQYRLEREQIAREEARRRRQERLTRLNDFQGVFQWPIPTHAPGNRGFGMMMHPIFREYRFHSGIDVGAPTGTPIYAAADGYVRFVGWMGGYGNTIIIDHGNGYSTLYAHNSRNRVAQDQFVRRGERIADVGSTGLSTGPHLHFEIRRNNTAVDPMAFFPR